MLIKEQRVCIADADTTLVWLSVYQIFTLCHAMDIYTQVDSSGSALSSNVVGDHVGQTECGWAEVGSFSLSLF